MLRLMRPGVAVLAAVIVVFVTGCAGPGLTRAAPGVATSSASVATGPSNAPVSAVDACPGGAPIHLPDDVAAVTQGYLCVRETRPVPGDGEWQFSVVKGVTSGLDAVVRTYRTPDAPLTNGACTADDRDPRVLFLRGSRTLAVRAPQDGCGQPSGTAVRAYEALGTVELSATKLKRVASQLAQTSGCSDMYKDMLAIEESLGHARQTSNLPSPVELGDELCIYAVTQDAHGYRFAWLSSARQLSRTDVDRINSALAGATVDASCSRHQHTRFALLGIGGATTLVALDGCAVQQDGGWWRASDRLRALLTA
jgi:hypothetical protein